jgi:hypothetical protein
VSSTARLRAVSTTFGDGETGHDRRLGSRACDSLTIFRPNDSGRGHATVETCWFGTQSGVAWRISISVPLDRESARNIGVHQTARASRIDIRAENFRATVALALQPSYSGSMSTSISRHDLVDSGAPTTRTQLLTVAARSSTPATTSRPKRAKLVVAARIWGASSVPPISIAPLVPMCRAEFWGGDRVWDAVIRMSVSVTEAVFLGCYGKDRDCGLRGGWG